MKIDDLEALFNESIAGYMEIERYAADLATQLISLQPEEIHKRCQIISTKQQELTDKSYRLFSLLEFAGPGVMPKHLLEMYRSLLEKTAKTYDRVSAIGNTHKMNLAHEIKALQAGRKGIAGYASQSLATGTVIQRQT